MKTIEIKEHNVLETWKKECYFLSSELNIYNRKLNRVDVDFVYNTLSEYFGIEKFFINPLDYNPKTKFLWIFSLLSNYKSVASIISLFEVCKTIEYIKTYSAPVKKKFKSLFNDPRQFRDIFFEIYIARLLENNGISISKKGYEDKKELDLTCKINNISILCECKKIYNSIYDEIDYKRYILERMPVAVSKLNKGVGFIGTFRIIENEIKNRKEIFENKIKNFVERFNSNDFDEINYEDCDSISQFIVNTYTNDLNAEINKKEKEFDFVFKQIPPLNIIPNVPNMYQMEIKTHFSIPENKSLEKLKSAIQCKINQHKDSNFSSKIFFFDNEIVHGADMPLLTTGKIFNENKMSEIVESLTEDIILCFIVRDYSGDIPKINIKVYGKNIDSSIKKTLENLKTDFDYKIN